MFFAQTLEKKLYSNYQRYLNNKNQCLFPYKFSKNTKTTLLSELKTEKPEYTHIQLKEMTQKDYLKNFTKKNLIKKWNRKCKVNYEFISNKFSKKLRKEILEAKQYIKNLVDKDIFDTKKPRWNVSTQPNDVDENIKNKIKRVKYEANHCPNNKLIKNELNKIYDEYTGKQDDVNHRWNISSKLEQKEKDLIDKDLFIKSMNNTQKYWFKNNFLLRETKRKNKLNKCNSAILIKRNKQLIEPVDEKNKKLFKENENDSYFLETNNSKNENLDYTNSSCKNFFKNKNVDKQEISDYRRMNNQWREKDLIKKIKLIEDLDEGSINDELNKTYRPEELKKEMLKNLMYNKNRIQMVENMIKEEKKCENYIKTMKELQNKKLIPIFNISKYPMTYKQKFSIETAKESINKDNKKYNDESKIFIEACQKLLIDKQNKNKKRILSCKNIKRNTRKYMYAHPGIYRQFDYSFQIYDNDDEKGNKKIEEKYMAWSCCNNRDKNSKGCEKIVVKVDYHDRLNII